MGEEGDVCMATAGYARNHLIPRRLAVPATPSGVARADRERRQRQEAAEAQLAAATALAEELARAGVTVPARATPSGELYGALSAKDIRAHVAAKIGRPVDMEASAVTRLGTSRLAVRLHPELAPTHFNLHVVPSDDSPQGQ